MEIESARPLNGFWQDLKIRRLKAKVQNPSWAVLVGAVTLSIYLALLPFVERTWRATGDEPHYLLTAHSLVNDWDFDLTNNYAQLDYLNFYFSKDITPQIRLSPTGQQILNHQLGLPLLAAPAYALGGRLGVLAFQAVLGGLLAALTFKLALLVSQDEPASVIATLFVALSPPLLLYNFLVYPELLGALLTTLVVYSALSQNKSKLAMLILTFLALVILPWLNRRFVPLALCLALLWVWRMHSGRLGQRLSAFRSPAVILLGTIVSVGLLLWFDSRLVGVAEPDITAPTINALFWDRLARGLVGWLVDQQRGLFIFAPIYIVALWGVPFLWGQRSHYRWVVLPFVLSLGITTVAGGFWVAWELGPRFLVVALPALAPLLALAWRGYSSKIGRGLILLLFGLSLSTSLVIIQNPELPYKSSLPLYYGQRLNLPLTEWLPDLAGYARITPVAAAEVTLAEIAENGQTLWPVEPGRSVEIFRSDPLTELPFGHYRLRWPLRAEAGLPPDTELLRLSLKLSGGGQLFNQVVTAADLTAGGGSAEFQVNFRNPNVDRWRTPLLLSAVSTGEGQLWAGELLVTPDPFYALWLPYLLLILLTAAAWLTWLRFSARQSDDSVTRLPVSPAMLWSLVVILPVGVLGYLALQAQQDSRTYQANELSHFVGQTVEDSQSAAGQAWLVDPQVDPPQKAIFGPFDIFDAGQYRVTFRLKLLEAAQTEQDIARLQIAATANYDSLLVQPIRLEHFSEPNLYHDFVLTFTNPRRQALSFELYYLGLAPLVIDGVTVTRLE